MTNETLAYYIGYFNRKKISDHIIIKKINKEISIVEIPSFFGQRKNPFELRPLKQTFFKYFLIKNKSEKYVGIVHDMGNSDLHWYITKANRKKGYLTNALKNTILPYLSKERDSQKISISKFYTGEYYIDCKNIAINLGFKFNGKDERGYENFKKILKLSSAK